MINKYLDQKPVWLFWETCTLNSLIRCYSSFLEHRKFYDMTYSLLYGVRLFRNAASHHNCLLIPPAATIKKTKVLDSLMPIFLTTDNPAREKTLYLAQSDPLIHDLSCILLSHINLVKSAGMRRYTEDQAASVLRRIDEHAAWYKDPQSGCDYLLDQFAAIKLFAIGIYQIQQEVRFRQTVRNAIKTENRAYPRTRTPWTTSSFKESPEPSHQCLVHWKL